LTTVLNLHNYCVNCHDLTAPPMKGRRQSGCYYRNKLEALAMIRLNTYTFQPRIIISQQCY